MGSKRKAQAAMEYLMTYGWAIIIIIIVAAALYYLNVFSPPTTNVASGLTGFTVPTGGWNFVGSSGLLTLQLRNAVGSNINITTATATISSQAVTNTTGSGITMSPNQLGTVTFPGFTTKTAGTPYQASLTVVYTNRDTGLAFTTTGTLSGSVS